jgi:hypothetical protein
MAAITREAALAPATSRQRVEARKSAHEAPFLIDKWDRSVTAAGVRNCEVSMPFLLG